MKICIAHFRIGELDGVSLEMEKWRRVLSQLGHEVYYLAGTIGNTDGYLIPDLSIDFKPVFMIQSNAFTEFVDFNSEEEFESEIVQLKKRVKQKIEIYINNYQIDLIVTNNIFSLPLNLPASLALAEVIEEKSLDCINISHDFYWERTKYRPTVTLVQKYLDELFPPKYPKIKQVVINSIAQKNLKQKKGMEAVVIPNVFYFKEKTWKKDKFNSDLRNKLRIDPNDIFILQATRIVRRKGIELIIDLIAQLNQQENLKQLREKSLYDGRNFSSNNNIVLVMPNIIENFETEYKETIESKLKDNNIEYRFCNYLFDSTRTSEPDKKYTLWDSYVHADIVSFPSLQEGWGNQFLEAIKARLPIVIFEYEVYKTDIGGTGFETISLGSKIEGYDKNGLVKIPSYVLNKAAEKTIHFLQNPEYRERIVTKNHSIGLEKYSLNALKSYIILLMENL